MIAPVASSFPPDQDGDLAFLPPAAGHLEEKSREVRIDRKNGFLWRPAEGEERYVSLTEFIQPQQLQLSNPKPSGLLRDEKGTSN